MSQFVSKMEDELDGDPVARVWSELEEFERLASVEDDLHYSLLPDGDTHVCKGLGCEHLVIHESGEMVCSLSGVAFGFDNRHSHMHNEMYASQDNTTRPWKFRKDNSAASRSAFMFARTMCPPSHGAWKYTKRARSDTSMDASTKGARCVDSNHVETATTHKLRPSHSHKKEISSVVRTLLSGLASTTHSDRSHVRVHSAGLLSQVATARYVERLSARSLEKMCITRLHDVLTAAQHHANELAQQDTQTERAGTHCSLTHQHVVRLVCMIHDALQITGALPEADSVRSIAAGILYALKRGIAIGSTELVPAMPSVTSHLPSIRKPSVSEAARALQSCSHRGVNIVHKAIETINTTDTDKQTSILRKFQDAAQIARYLNMAHCASQ